MSIQSRLIQAEKALSGHSATHDLRAMAEFAFPFGGTPPDLPEGHFAKPFVDILIEMNRLTCPDPPTETEINNV
jgi:hypothetical protein